MSEEFRKRSEARIDQAAKNAKANVPLIGGAQAIGPDGKPMIINRNDFRDVRCECGCNLFSVTQGAMLAMEKQIIIGQPPRTLFGSGNPPVFIFFCVQCGKRFTVIMQSDVDEVRKRWDDEDEKARTPKPPTEDGHAADVPPSA